jgi:hypothetical protein
MTDYLIRKRRFFLRSFQLVYQSFPFSMLYFSDRYYSLVHYIIILIRIFTYFCISIIHSKYCKQKMYIYNKVMLFFLLFQLNFKLILFVHQHSTFREIRKTKAFFFFFSLFTQIYKKIKVRIWLHQLSLVCYG